MVFLGRTRRIHFVGIGGIGMSGIAEVLINLGFEVSGSDLRESDTTERLTGLGATVFVGHSADNVSDADVVVYSSAVNTQNPEVSAALEQGIPAIPRTEMLAELMRLKFAVTVGGSHGKTSTTSLAAAVLARGGLDPTVVVGGKLRAISSNARLGDSRYLVAEADESDGQFVKLPSSIAVITNIDLEHLDHYRDLDDIKDAFIRYANRVPFYGAVIVCADDANAMSIVPELTRRTITYSLGGDAQVTARIVSQEPRGTTFEVTSNGEALGEICLGIPGEHYVRNALAAVAIGLEMEIPFGDIRDGLEAFQGVGRRFEIKGEQAGVIVVDDYGHHPTEIAATIAAARANFDRRVLVVFQPHRYSRTQSLIDDFAQCFVGADHVAITPLYAAGERPIPGVDEALIVDRVNESGGVSAVKVDGLDEAVDWAVKTAVSGDLVLAMGAGNIYTVCDRILARLAEKGVSA